MMHDAAPNRPAEAQHVEDWSGEMGAKWLANLDRFEGMLAPIGSALMAQAGFKPGERVLDLGCGGGATSLEIARLVAPSGEVLGLDISPDLVGAARSRAEELAHANVRFVCGDAAKVRLDEAPFDRLFSRFGAMFFAVPVAAFANIRTMLRPDARMDLAVWGPPRDNPWMMEVMGVVRSHIEVPPAVPRTPGPFAFEDTEYLREVLTESGFRSVNLAPYLGRQAVGGPAATPEQAADFVLSSLAAGRALAAHGEAVLAAARNDLVQVFIHHYIPGEGVMLGCKVWLVSATS